MNRRKIAAVLAAASLTAVVVGTAAPALAGSDSGLSSAYKPSTSEIHAQTKYWWANDEIGRCDTWPDGFSVYANFSYAGVSGSTPQYNGGYNNCLRYDLGTIAGGTTVSQRAAVQVEGGTNWYGGWSAGVA